MSNKSVIRIVLALFASLAYSASAETVPATVSYTLPTDGPLPRTWRVTLAITAPDNPDWIVSTFVAGEPRTVTEENQGRFTETWDGLDDNFMPVPPGEYGVKGIYMPSEIWAPDGKQHTLRAKLHSSPFTLAPKPGVGETGPFIWGDPISTAMGDVAVGPDGIAVFYWNFLENGNNPYRVDLTQPLGHGQLLGGFGSGGTGGGDYVATDGQTVWALAPTDDLVADGRLGLVPLPAIPLPGRSEAVRLRGRRFAKEERHPCGGARHRPGGLAPDGLGIGAPPCCLPRQNRSGGHARSRQLDALRRVAGRAGQHARRP
jgi:hypothetical protein